jgi:pimeloyl-ACP methyl ester carboxylesterase
LAGGSSLTAPKNRDSWMEVKLHSETSGSLGAPRVVLCHGFGGSARNWRMQARLLRDDFRVTLFDLRGHSRSAAPDSPEGYLPEALLSDLDELVSAEDVPVILGGLSLGAKLGLDYALDHPERVRALLLASYPTSGEDPKRRAWALGFADAIEAHGLDAAGAEFVWGERSRFDPKGAALIRQGLLEHSPYALAQIQRQVLATSRSPQSMAARLRQLTIPTCLIAGSDDPESLKPCQELAELLPNAELHVLEGAGHVVNLTKPAEFNHILQSFLSPFRVPS